MSTHNPPPCPKGPYSIEIDEAGVKVIVDANGQPVIEQENGAERLVECANIFQKIWLPGPHVKTLTEQAVSLEALRKAAYARVLELEKELEVMKENGDQRVTTA